MKNRILKYILIIILSISVLGGFVGNYFVNFVLSNKVDKTKVNNQDKDGFVPVSHAEKIYSKINSKKEKYIFKDAKHVRAERMYKKEYWEYIDKFLDKYFK